jgi:hypothetical protein
MNQSSKVPKLGHLPYGTYGRISGGWERLAKVLYISHTGVSSDRLQLSCFKLGGRILLVLQF